MQLSVVDAMCDVQCDVMRCDVIMHCMSALLHGARACRHRLRPPRTRHMLHQVPLGVTSRARFWLVNESYDNAQLALRLPPDRARLPLQVRGQRRACTE